MAEVSARFSLEFPYFTGYGLFALKSSTCCWVASLIMASGSRLETKGREFFGTEETDSKPVVY